MQGFNFSRKEYLNLYRRVLPSQKITKNFFTYQRPDSSEVALNMWGYPIQQSQSRKLDLQNPDRESAPDPDRISDSLLLMNPDLVAVQMDPLPFMHTARSFAINYLPSLKEQMSSEQKGIFQ